MANVFDVAHYILEKKGRMTTLKLQKLVYYSQAWSLAWDDKALFPEEIQAWSNGPVCPQLYSVHRGDYTIDADTLPCGNGSALGKDAIETIDIILKYYGDRDAYWLRELTHKEDPWRIARGGLPDEYPSKNPITHDSMKLYYSSL